MEKQAKGLSHGGNEIRRHQDKVRLGSCFWLLFLSPDSSSWSIKICSIAFPHIIALTF